MAAWTAWFTRTERKRFCCWLPKKRFGRWPGLRMAIGSLRLEKRGVPGSGQPSSSGRSPEAKELTRSKPPRVRVAPKLRPPTRITPSLQPRRKGVLTRNSPFFTGLIKRFKTLRERRQHFRVAHFLSYDVYGRAPRYRLERLFVGVTSQARATREAPAQAELRPTRRRARNSAHRDRR
jgi:hypothetical protein